MRQKRMHRSECIEWETNFVHHISLREIYLEYIKNSFSSTIKEKPNIKVGKKKPERQFSKEDIQMLRISKEDSQHH